MHSAIEKYIRRLCGQSNSFSQKWQARTSSVLVNPRHEEVEDLRLVQPTDTSPTLRSSLLSKQYEAIQMGLAPTVFRSLPPCLLNDQEFNHLNNLKAVEGLGTKETSYMVPFANSPRQECSQRTSFT